MSDSGKAVFLSYASQDAEAAKRICDALRAAGVEVWFDQSELVGGDAWDAKIRRQIKECALFVPIISANTNARPEGYFRLEWKLAVDRSHLLADDHPFLLPIAIGDVSDAAARVPDKFRDVQWTRLRLDETPAELGARVARLLSGGAPENRARRTEDRAGRSTPKAPPAWLRYAWVGVGIVFALVYAVRPLLQTTRRPGPKPPAVAVPAAPARVDDKSVAVLAFANLSDDKAGEYFSDGISEELLNVLAKIPGLKVSARTSAFYFKGKEVPVPEIAKQLGVAYIVEGSVQRSGDKVRIIAQLIKAADGFHVWSDTFTRDLKDVFAVQDEIAGLIANNLQLKMGIAPIESRREINPEAHRLVLEGRHFWNLRTNDGFDRAEAAFRQAIVLDPSYASAHAGLANVLATRIGYRAYEGEIDLSFETARVEAQRAIALDPADAGGYPGLALTFTNEGRLAEAEEVYQKALALNPGYALSHHWRSLVLELEGRIDEAIAEIDRAVELDPLSGIAVGTQARMLLEAGRYAEAFATFERSAAILPDRPTLAASRAMCLLKLNRPDEAVAWARKVAASTSRELRLVADADAIFVLRQTGHEAEAAAHAERVQSLLGPQSYQRGAVLAAMGRLDEALPYLERTPTVMPYVFFWSSLWDQWRDDPRFARLLTKLGREKEYRVARETVTRMTEGKR